MLLFTALTTSIGLICAREQLVGIHIDHGLAVLAAEDGGDFGALHHRDLIADLELGEIVKLRFVQALALHRDQADRQAGGIELQHHRRQRAGRQAFQIGQRQIRELPSRRHRRWSRAESKTLMMLTPSSERDSM